MALLQARRCSACSAVYEVLVHRGDALGVDHPEEKPECVCGSGDYEPLVGVPRAQNLDDIGQLDEAHRYPYYSTGLGLVIRSAKHLREVLDRRGLVHCGGCKVDDRDVSIETQMRWAQADRDLAEYEDYIDRLEHDSEFAGWRRERDRRRR